MAKKIKETIREMMTMNKPFPKSNATDPLHIGDENDPQDTSLLDDFGQTDSEGDKADLSDLEGTQPNSKPEPGQTVPNAKDTEGIDDELPPDNNADGTAADAGTGTDLGGDEGVGGDTNISAAEGGAKPVQSGQKFKVKTVYGEEEVDLKELTEGYMKGKHYTQVMQVTRAKERRISELLSNPERLVEFALENGVDLKPLVHQESEFKKIELPPLDEDASEEEKRQHKFMQAVLEDRERMSGEIKKLQAGFSSKERGAQWAQAEAEFDQIRGDVPASSKFLAVLAFNEGKRQFGSKYRMTDAVADLKIAYKDVLNTAFESPEGKRKIAEIERNAVSKYLATKQRHHDENLSGDLLNTTRKVPRLDKAKKFTNIKEAVTEAKKKFNIQ